MVLNDIKDLKQVDKCELTEYQKNIWLEQKVHPDSSLFNIGGYMKISGEIKLDILEKAVNFLIKEADALRTIIDDTSEEPIQKYIVNIDYKLPFHDFSNQSNSIEYSLKWLQREMTKPFKENDILFQFQLIKVNKNLYYWFTKFHHIITDGWSISLIHKRIIEIYNKLLAGEIEIEKKLYHYKDFVFKNKEYLSSKACKRDEIFWNKKLESLPESIMPKKLKGNLVSSKKTLIIKRSIYDKIEKFSKENGCSAFHFILGTVFIYFSKVYGKDEFAIGVPVLNRKDDKEKATVGIFSNVLPFEVKIDQRLNFVEFMVKMKKELVECYEYERFPLKCSVRKSDNGRKYEKSLFDIAFSYLKHDYSYQFSNCKTEYKLLTHQCEKNALTIFVSDFKGEEAVNIDFDYQIDMFDKNFPIENVIADFEHLLYETIENPYKALLKISILTKVEMKKIMYEFNNTKMEYPRNKTIVKLFEEQVEKTPQNTAVVFKSSSITYEELNNKANKLARVLRKKGIGAENIVGIMVEKSIELIVGMMAILKSGGAYLPIDPNYPKRRIEYILEDSKAKILISKGNLAAEIKFSGVMLDLKGDEFYKEDSSNLNNITTSNNLAYVIYTSGTTGVPKGVLIEHRALVNMVFWHKNYYSVTSKDRASMYASNSFDASIGETFPYLLSGATLYIIPDSIRLDLIKLNKYYEENCITNSFLPTQFCEMFMKLKNNSLKHLMTGGEKLKSFFKNNYSTTNCYGPTETTVLVAAFTVDDEYENIPIGKPIANTKIYIVDKYNNLQPIGVTGEICISGDGLARGYLNRLELTREKFVESPFEDGKRMYKTGDLARWLPNGNIEYIGRIDNQVKIRGFRIELGEIETQILKLDKVKEAAVLARQDENGNKYVCAYVVIEDKFHIKDLKEELADKLPDYMLPTYFIQMEQMPLTTNGKINKKLLPKPENSISTEIKYEAPRNDVEKELFKLWKSLLNVNKIGINDDFFKHGGDSLKVAALKYRINKQFNIDIPLKYMFKNSTIKSLYEYISNAKKNIYTPIKAIEKKEYYPVSSAQKRMYLVSQFNNVGVTYNIPMLWEVKGKLDLNKLEKVLKEIIKRHDSFRTYFALIDGEPVQKIYEQVEFKIAYKNAKEDEVQAIANEFIKPFELNKAPLLRGGVIKISDERQILILDTHHIIFDGMSMGVFEKEFSTLYLDGKLQALNIHYKDFSEWQRNLMKTEVIQEQKKYWLSKFKEEIPVLNLQTDYKRLNCKSFEGNNVRFKIEKQLTEKLTKVIKDNGVTLYMLLFAAYNVLLFRYTGQEDIIVGTPVAGRTHPDLKNLMGMFVNTVAMRNYPKGEKTFKEFLFEIRETALGAFENEEYQFEELVSNLNIPRDNARNPLFDVVFVLENMNIEGVKVEGLEFKPYAFETKTSKFDFSLIAKKEEGEIKFNFEYCTKLFKKETIERLAEHYVNILKAIAENLEVKLSEVNIISEYEKRQLLIDFNNAKEEYPRLKTIVDLFEEQVKRTPQNTVVVYRNNSITYEELNEKSNKLARILREKGVKADDIVGIMMEKSIELIIGIVAILKSGGAYLPVDPNYPEERIKYMLEDSGTSILLTKDYLKSKVKFKGTEINLEDGDLFVGDGSNLKRISTPKNLAYVIYTSGTTGKPKGVLIEHESLVNVALWHNKYHLVTSSDRAAMYASNSFDASVEEIFPYLISGAALYIIPEEIRLELIRLNEYYEKNKITIGFLPTQFCELFMKLGNKSLRRIIVAGDKLKCFIKNKYEIINCYGPTECTVLATAFEVKKEYCNIPIGKPIANAKLYVLDNNNNLQPIGVAGELCISGIGLARGYLNKPELTREKFVDNPFAIGKRMYKTGDLVRWLPDGNIEYIGRKDNQVKVRGFRIELGEIETQLLKLKEVKEAAVVAREDVNGNKCICAYVVKNKVFSVKELKQELLKSLPDYMIPAYFVEIEKMPLTSNEKINRKALPPIDMKQIAREEYEAPRSDIEKSLVEVWQLVLGVEKIGINDDFFDLGGDSIKAIKIVSKLIIDFEITINDIFENKTVASLAKKLKFNKNNLKHKIDFLKEAALTKDLDNEKICYGMNQYKILNRLYDEINVKKEIKYNKILLTGATGYLGIHILRELLKQDDKIIYLIVRGNSKEEAKERLIKNYEFYFKENICEQHLKNIKILNGDLTVEKFGLEKEVYETLAREVECIINSAANVKHYGKYKEFYDINVLGVKRIIEFAGYIRNKALNHISTISIGLGKSENENLLFSEYDNIVNDNIENYYLKTKVMAEKLILQARNNKINTNIFRVGNIVFNSETGIFQKNIGENGFYEMVKSYIKLGRMPKMDFKIDFSFVDYVSKAITLLYNRCELNNEIYHIFNPNYVDLILMDKLLRKLNMDIKLVPFEDFLDYIYYNYNKAELRGYIDNFLVHSQMLEGSLKVENHSVINVCEKTEKILSKLGFQWPELNLKSMNKMIEHCKKVNFI